VDSSGREWDQARHDGNLACNLLAHSDINILLKLNLFFLHYLQFHDVPSICVCYVEKQMNNFVKELSKISQATLALSIISSFCSFFLHMALFCFFFSLITSAIWEQHYGTCVRLLFILGLLAPLSPLS